MLKRFESKKIKKLAIGTIVVLFAIAVALVAILIANKSQKTKERKIAVGPELARAMTYDQFQDGDEDIDGTDYVKFGAFFLRDINGDGYAEKIKGTCKQIGKEDTLYMELNVLTNGYLENGVITINGNNFYLQTAIPKDSEIKDNVISNNATQISLNQINNGTQKLITGIVKSGNYSYDSQKTAAIGNDSTKMSGTNSITLTGTHVAADGTRTAINKTIELNMDWYGTTTAEIPNYINGTKNLNQLNDITTVIDETNQQAVFEVTLGMQEKNNELILTKAHMNGTIPQMNGYNPISVKITNSNVDFSYDKSTRTFTAEKSTVLDTNGKVQTQCYDGMYSSNRYNQFALKVAYPLEAYNPDDTDTVELRFPIEGYYEGYNNTNTEFTNPYKSNIAKSTIIITFSTTNGAIAKFDVYVGEFIQSPGWKYVVSKKNPLRIYNGISAEENNDTYMVSWIAAIGNVSEDEGITLKETKDGEQQVFDQFIKADASNDSMENMVSNIGVGFSNPLGSLKEDGWIRVYDEETGNLVHEFTKADWSKYTKNSPYKFQHDVKNIRVETSDVKANSLFTVYILKSLNDEYITENYSREEFDNLKYIKSTLAGYVGDICINVDTHNASYEAPYSMSTVSLSKTAISTQETEKDIQIKIKATGDEDANQISWKNGAFLLKLPKDIIDVEIDSVESNISSVTISSYETYEENGERFIKINTTNQTPTSFELTINCIVTPDPRIPTTTEDFELYASNEDANDYYNATSDIYDVNGNLNTTEKVAKSTASISLVSPNSLLTNQITSNYDDEGSVAVAPQIALVSKDRRTATVNIELNNNYSSTISDVQVLGRVPVKGNKYAVTNEDMGSMFTTTMTNEGITLPNTLKLVVTVYYSENGAATRDLTDSKNGWTTTPSDYSKVKSYLIDFGDYKLDKGEKHTISYNISIPAGLDYNQVSYSHHGVYFSLDTTEGKYKTRTEPNKVGFMIAKQYDLELTKYQKNKTNVVSGATYAVYEDGSDEAKTRVTGVDGKLTLTGLYLDRTYIVKEIKSPDDYELNEEVVKFTTSESNGTLTVTKQSGTVKKIQVAQATDDTGYKVQIEVEDEAKVRLKVKKTEKDTTTAVKGIGFKITGSELPENGKNVSTNINGEIVVKGLQVGAEYTLEETKANGYYLISPIKFKVTNNRGTYTVSVTDGETEATSISEEDNIPIINISLVNEKIPTYDLDISKIKKVTSVEEGTDGTQQEETVYLQGAKFKLYKGTKELGTYVTDENGKIFISGLYQYIDGKDEEAVYVLKETFAPEGYAKVKDISFKVDGSTGKLKLINTEGREEKYTVEGTTVKLTIEDSPSFKLIKKDGETGDRIANIKFAIYNVEDGETPAKNSKGEILGTKEIIDGKEYYTVITDSNGEISADLPEGMYKAVEVQTPEKYEETEPYYFGIGMSREGTIRYKTEWAKGISGSASEALNSVITTADGGILVGGYIEEDKIKLENATTLETHGYRDGVIIKYNQNGEAEWGKTIGGDFTDSITSIIETRDGSYIAVGSTTSSTLDLGNGIAFSGLSSSNAMIIKYNSDLECEWAKIIKSSTAVSVSECGDGSYVVGGSYSGALDFGNGITLEHTSQYFSDGYVVKYSESGEAKWARGIIGAKADNIKTVAGCDDGGCLIGGDYESTEIDLGNGFNITMEDGPVNSLIVKYDANGNVEFINDIRNRGFKWISSIKQCSDGGYIVGGHYTMSLDLENGVTLTYAPDMNKRNGMIIKYNSSGEAQWARAIGIDGDNDDFVKYVSECSDGGYIVGGTFTSSKIDLGNGVILTNNGIGNNDGMLIKYDSAGEIQWARVIGGTNYEYVHAVAETQNGDYIVAGYYGSATVNFGNGITLKNNNSWDGMLAKYTKTEFPTPSVIQAKAIGGVDSDTVSAVTATSDGGYIVGGEFSSNNIDLGNGVSLSNNGQKDGIIIKAAVNGEIEWVQKIGGVSDEYIRSVIETNDGGYIVGGYFSSEKIELGKGNILTNNGSNDGMLVKYNSIGEIEWANVIGGTADETIISVTETNDGGCIVGGYFSSGKIDLGNGNVLVNNRAENNAGMVIKYDSNGLVRWSKAIEGTTNNMYIYSAIETNDGGCIVGGYFNSLAIDLENGISLDNKGARDGMVIKYGPNQEVQWSKVIGGTSNDRIKFVIQSKDGGFLVAVNFQSSDIELENGVSVSNNGYYDGMMIKYNEKGELEWTQTIGEEGNDCINSIIETSDGGYIVGGYFSSSTINLGNDLKIDKKKLYDGMIIKYNKDGFAEWAKSIGGTTNTEEICSVAETKDSNYIVGGTFYSSKIELENGLSLTNKGDVDGMVLKITPQGGVPEVQELEIINNRKEFIITTDVQEIDNVKGGSISGEDINPYEKIRYGDTSIKEIKMVPDEGYEIIGITVNGKEYKYTANADGSYTMPAFSNITENKHIVVTYSLKNNKIIINKVDKDTKEKLAGAKFKLDQIEERSEPDSSVVIGNLTDNGKEYTQIELGTEVTGKLGTLTNNGTYYFTQNSDGTMTPTNKEIASSTANSYISIDLTGKTGQYAVVVNASCSSEANYDMGYATITEDTTAPAYDDATGNIMCVSGVQNAKDYSLILNGGKMYYLHLGYSKDGIGDKNEDQVVINSIKLYNATSNTVTYNFVNNNGKYESTNQGQDNTVANSYIPIDLTNGTGKYKLTVNAEVSAPGYYDYGYAVIKERTTRPSDNESKSGLIFLNGTKTANDYTTDLQGGKMYYLHLGYYRYKSSGTVSGDDKFTVNSVNIELSNSDIYHTTVETNSDGEAITQIPFGKYNVTEIQAPDGYVIDNTPRVIEFRGTEGAIHEFTIENEHKPQLIVHHYIKGTTTKLDDDESYEGIAGDKYTTSPKLDLEKYELEVDANGAYVLPVNAVGTYKSGETEVTYYYVEKSIPLTVHHYIEGTTECVPLKDGGTASDVTGSGKEGKDYTTSAIADDELSDEYELVETPANASGTYSGSEVVVNYYYKKVARDVNLVKYKEDGVTPLEGAKFTIDGTEYTTNVNGRIQTKLEVGTHEVIEIEAPEGYKLPDNPKTSVTIIKATTSEDINITNEKKKGTVTVHHYIEGTTNRVLLSDGALAADETKIGNAGDIYATQAKTNLSEKYELASEPENSSGTYVDGNIEVVYYYRIIPAVVTVHHYLEGTTTKLVDDVIINGTVGEEYTTVVGNVDNKYKLVATPANATGKMTRDGIEVIYYYRLKSTSVLVHYYIEETTTSLSADKTIPGKVDDKYTTATATDIPSQYELVATPSNASGTMAVEQIVVTYYYRLKETGVDVHYYKEGTTEKVSANKTIAGKVDDKYTTSPATDVPSKYELVATPANASGTMTEARITVIYYYRLKDTSVLVHHYIEGTTTKLSNDVTVNGKVDDSYTTKVADDIPSKYELVSTPTNASGTMTENQIVVTYYYRLKNTSVLVHHYIKDTTISLSVDITINGKADDSYTTKVADDIPEQYELVAMPNNAKGTMTEDQIVVIYYYQLKSYPYTVNYLEKDTNEILHEPKQGDELVYGSQINTADEQISIDGYNYDSADKDVLTIGITNNVINLYFTKRTDLSYKVNYLEKGTNQVIHEQKVQDGMTYDAEVISADEVIGIDGYNYDSVDKDSLKITTGENVINIYYTKKTDLSYKVNYLEKDTNKVLNPQKIAGNKTFGEVITSSTEVIEIDGYNYDSVDKNSLKITTGENVINIYYTKRADLSYTVNYLEKGTNKVLSNPKTENNVTFGITITSISEKIDINGYNYDSADKASITITTGTNVINLYYTKKTDLSYTVNYLEKGTNKVLHEQKTQTGMTFGSTVNSADEKITINGYNFDRYDKDTLTITTGENVINIYYTKRTDLSYKVNYLEKTTNKVLHDQKVVENMTFESVVNSADEKIDINGYNFDSYDKDTLTIGTGENVINIYYTKRADLSYTVNYLESVTNNVLHEPKVQTEMTYEDKVNAEDEVIDIDGYNYDYPDKYELVIGTDENVINIYYSKVTGLSYTVNYLEKDTNKTLFPSNNQGDMTFGDVINSSDEIITIDGYNFNSFDKDTLTIGTGENVINIYYTKRNDLSYKVNYLEKDTNKELHGQKVVENMTFEDEVTSANEVITIDGYNYDSVDKATLKITTGENVINIYYTKRTDLSYKVNYLEKDTNKVLHEQKVVENMTFEDEILSANEVIAIDGYNYDSVDKATLKITTGENVINIYYTKRTDLSYKVNYLEKDTNKELHGQKVVENMTFEDEVTSANEVITIDGYNYDSVDKATLKITTGENVINIYYTKRNDLSYTVNYLEKDTNKVLSNQKVVENVTFEDEITSADEVIEIDGYNYDSVDKDTLVIGTGENIINIYYTKRNDLSYKVNYLEKDTNKVIHDQKVVENVTFEDEITSANEVIEIDGYNYDSVDKDMLKITTGENIINIYYTKRNDLSYKVNYLEKDTNKVIHDQKVVENVTFEDEITSANEVITIYGYNYDSVDKEVLKISTGENVINIYYIKKEAKVTVHYYEENSTNKVSEDKEITGKVNDEYVTAIADDIPSKYELVATPANATGTMTEDTIEVIYYFRKKATQVVVRHYEEGTKIKLSEDITIDGRVDDPYTTEAATDVPIKYELSVTPANANGTMTENIIEVIYYYRVKDAVLNIRYLEKGTEKELAQPEQQHGKVDEEYITGAKTIDGYTLVEHSGNERGKFEVNPLTVTYYYLYNTRATVQYIDKITGQILEQSTTEGLEGDDFVTESKSFDNYILVEEPAQKTVKMTKEEQVLKYYYIHVSGGVIEKHIDMISGEILSNDTHQGNEGDTYNIPSRTFQGYDLVEDRLPANAQGTMTVNPIEVIYYYIYKSKVTAQYVDKNTGEKLTEDEVQNGHEKDAYITDRKTFDDYKLVEVPANADGEMTKKDITVTYNYVHTSGGVIVNHIDINTGKQLLDETKQEGYEGDPYETHEENIPGYTLVKEKYPANAQGIMAREETRVTYYYVKNTEVNIKYIDKETGEEITEKTNIPGKEGENYTTEPKDISGYDLVEEPTNKDGTMTAEPIDVIYYYRRPAKVVVKYIDQETNEEIATEEKQEGHQNDEYTTEAKDIKYYKLIATPDNATGTMKVTVTKDETGKDIVEDTTYVTYYYRKLIFNLNIDKKVSSVTVNGEESIINGDLGKVEVHRKELNTAKVEVKYIIKVTNNSELTGKASILEDIPTGMIMNAEKNAGWEVKGTTATRETKELQPGESEEYLVVLDWENGENNIGMKENTASIISIENEAGFEEKNTTDNEDKADIIVAIGTGGHTYVLIAGGMLLILISLACGVYVVKKVED